MFNPEDLLDFIEIGTFTQRWKELKLDVESDLAALQFSIMANPTSGRVIQGTGGLRKLRFAPLSWQTGKRGAARVCYVFLKEFGMVLLVTAYGKREKDDLSNDDKRMIRQLIQEAQAELERRKTIK